MEDHYKIDRQVLEVLARNFDAFDCKGRVAKIKSVEFRVKVKANAHIPITSVIKYDPKRK